MKQQELLATQNGIEEKNTDSQNLVYREQVEGSPFWIIGDNNRFFLVMGRYRFNKEDLKSVDEVYEWMAINQWEITLKMILTVLKDQQKLMDMMEDTDDRVTE